MKVRRLLAGILVFMITAVCIMGCGSSSGDTTASTSTEASEPNGEAEADSSESPEVSEESAETPQTSSRDTLVIRVASDNKTVDYHNNTADNTTRLRSLICNTLLEPQRNSDGDIEFVLSDESLATDYQLDDDNLGITFTIRDGVKFSDGSDMTTGDIAFSIKLYSDLVTFIDYDNITTTEDTVYVPLKSPDASMLYWLGVMIPIYSEQHYNDLGGEAGLSTFYYTGAMGTGPYMISEWVDDDYIALVANENYFAGAPLIKNVRIRMISETSVALMELDTDGIQMLIDPGTKDVEDVLAGEHPGVVSVESKGTQQYVLGFNCAGPLHSKELREAICYAIDRDEINQTVYGIGTYTAPAITSLTAEGVVEDGSWPYTYDPEKAKELVEASDYNGETLTYLVGGGDQARTAVGERLISYLEEIGVKMEIVNVDKQEWAQMITTEQGWDIQTRGISAAGITYLDYYNNLLLQTGHFEKCDGYEDYMAAITSIAQTVDETERNKLWADFQTSYMTDYAYSISLSQVKDYTLMSDKLHGAEKVSLFKLDLKDAYFE